MITRRALLAGAAALPAGGYRTDTWKPGFEQLSARARADGGAHAPLAAIRCDAKTWTRGGD